MEECTLELPAELAAEIDAYCRTEHVHREEAIRRLLDEWLERRRPDS